MLRLIPLIFKAIILTILITACSLPRGAALQSEILSTSKASNSKLAVYPVTKEFLPIFAGWPATGVSGSVGWLRHVHNDHTSIIAVADKITLVIWDNEENSLLTAPQQKVIPIANVTVSPEGSVFVPYLNQVKIAGLSDEAARQKIQNKLEKIIPSAQVQLTSIPGAHRSVSLVGGVVSPGNYPIRDTHYTVLNLISQGGGASPALENPQVRLIRAGRVYTTSLSSIYANPSLDSVLKGDDKVIVQRDKRFFRSLGAAAKEQLIYFEEDKITALDAMALIGGINDNRANPKAILVLREYPNNAVRQNTSGPSNTRSVFVIDLTSSDGLFSAGKFTINPNDTVLVTESPITAINTVFRVIGSVFGISNQLK
ncbi:MAG: polysaccharide export protein [Amylibacter sp.]|nr:polysaccharide export protein [Amylibacter sp.]